MATAIGQIHGEPVLETLTANTNGSYSPSTGKDGFSAVTVNVPGSTLVSKSITANGSYNPSSDNADGYSSVTVNVPNSYTAGDEGKVVSSGALVAQTARSSEITINGTYDTTNNNSVVVDVSGGGGAVPSLPNSIQANILPSAYLGNFADTSTPWDGFVFYNGANAFASHNYMYLATNSYIEYDLGSSKSVTIYFVGAGTDYATNYPTLFGLIYWASNGNIAVVNGYNGVAHFSRFGSELSGMPVINTQVEHCWTIAVNAEAKTAKLYADGQYIGVLTLNNVGQYIRVAAVGNGQYLGNVLVDYVGVVEEEEAAETIVSNQQSLMTVFGISGGSE